MAIKAIDSLNFGSDTHVFTLPYGSCSTAAGTAAKTVSVPGNNFSLETGARVLVKFTATNTASSPTLNVSSTGAKAIYYRGTAINKSDLAANRTYEFVYNGTQWELIGDIDTKVTVAIDDSGTTELPLLLATGSSAYTGTAKMDTGVKLNPSTNTISASISGNAATATKVNTKLSFTGGTTTNYDGSTARSIALVGKAISGGGEIFNSYDTNTASGFYSHAEGGGTSVTKDYGHAEGYMTSAGYAAHSEGTFTDASGTNSHAEGNGTIASSPYQHVQGKFNIEDTKSTYVHIVGKGSGAASRSNAHTLDWSGNAWFSGDVLFGGTGQDTATRSVIGGLDKIDNTNVAYGVCSTAAGTAAKTVTVADTFQLVEGAMVAVKFTYANSVASPTLNVNGTGAKPMYRYGTTALSTGTTTTGWYAGSIQVFIYDGTGWVRDYWNNTTYSNASLGQGYGTCSTAAATTAKAVTLSSYALTNGGIVSVKFTYAVPAGATMNINSKGAKAIFYKGAAITANVINAGNIATFIYDGTQYHLLAIDTVIPSDAKFTDTIYTLPTASSSTLGGVKIGSNLSISNGVLSVPTASGTQAGATIVYPAESCTTFSSDSGTVTPLAVQKGAKMFSITRPSGTEAGPIARFINTTGDVEYSKIKIENVTNTRDTSKTAQVISIPAEGGKKMVYGYCTDQIDGTSFIGGIFDSDATEFPYNQGLAIGGTSGNLLWKGKQVATTDMIKAGTITGVTAGNGLTGGGSSGSVTLNVGAGTGITVAADAVKAKLRSETALTNDSSAAAEGLPDRVYPVAVDKSGYLAVNVPWTDTVVSYSFTPDRAMVSNSSGSMGSSMVTSTELGYLSGVTSGIQSQLNGKAAASHNQSASTITSGTLAVARGGTGVTSHTDTTYTTARYRASTLTSTATNPTVNGVINWWYE